MTPSQRLFQRSNPQHVGKQETHSVEPIISNLMNNYEAGTIKCVYMKDILLRSVS